jgi:hypothetical protein
MVAGHSEDSDEIHLCHRREPKKLSMPLPAIGSYALILVQAVSLFRVPLVAYAHQRFREPPLLLIIEACEEGLSRISKCFLIGGTLAHIIGFSVHAVDDIDRALFLGAILSRRIFAVGPAFADVAHRTLESGPVLFLVWREAQVSPDTRRLGIDLIRKLVCGEFRAACAVLGVG